MTKRWNSVRSDLITTKRAASKATRREQKMLAELEALKSKCTEIVPEDIIPWLTETSEDTSHE